jgi:selenocysteine-specific elongation factor
LDLSKEEV